ncbi:MAG: MFS transporter [Acidobacteria bacterium]|nr:MFS transporter [Acidobacteriota bacterium]
MNDKRELRGWYFYDWANSAFYTTVVTVFLGPYLTEITKAAADAGGFVYPLGIKVAAGSFFPYMVSLSVALQVFVLPVLGAVADYSHIKKQMLAFFAYLGAFTTMGLYFVQGNRYILGGVLFLVANLSFGASIVIYNSFLNDIASEDKRDEVSSKGFALGYAGGGLLLALNLWLFARAESFGLSTGQAVRISLVSAGAWWAIFTLIPMVWLKSRQALKSLPDNKNYLTIGFSQLGHTLKGLPRFPHTLLFLLGFLLYNDGIQTVIAVASQFGQEELHLDISTLTTVVLMIQFIAFFGANIFNYIAKAVGAKRAIIISIAIWTATLLYAYAYLQTKRDFFVMGAIIGIVLGGSQALSRSLFSLMIPKGQEAEFFSLYEVSDKGTSWIGPLLFGLTFQLTGSYRLAILSLAILFILGLLLLTLVNARKAILAAGNELPAKV